MIKHYSGPLGNFQYDDREFELKYNCYLYYIGTETDGSKIKIPAGVTNCYAMFSSCSSLLKAPKIPAGITNCYGMFWGCRSLTQAPTIPEGITDCDYMFYGCSSLQNYSLDNATFSDDMYCSCPPSIIQEIDSFVQKFKERNYLNDK